MIKVYHQNNYKEGMKFYSKQTLDKVAMSLYSLVATVNTNDLDEAFELTNHLDKNWSENDKVDAVSSSVRSTMVGDLMEIDEEFYIVLALGFKKLS